MPEYNEYQHYQSNINNGNTGIYNEKDVTQYNNENQPFKQDIYEHNQQHIINMAPSPPGAPYISAPSSLPVPPPIAVPPVVPTTTHEEVVEKKEVIQNNNMVVPQTIVPSTYDSSMKIEKYGSILWLIFIAIYWTIFVLGPCIATKDLTNRHFYIWIAAAIAMLCVTFCIKEGKYPSGRVREDPSKVDGIGRFGALALIFVMCIDYFVIISTLINDNNNTRDETYFKLRVAFHSIALFWISLFFYKRFIEYNGNLAHFYFITEWFDIIISWIVIYLLHNSIDTRSDRNYAECFDEFICIAYYIFIILKMCGWLFPMLLIDKWGTLPKAIKVASHVIVLDLLTDLPIVIIILVDEAYRFHGILFFDVFYKILLVIRAAAIMLYGCFSKSKRNMNNNIYYNPNVPPVQNENVTVKHTVQQQHVI
jgi:hypothetical protein